ncbi:MAG: hypothetical protein JWO72_67 [Caulobacteraceae bacterium]|jgi:hypothetical protein|nr:hypothetical protein [Caulobacteraceae bacterium]
MKFARAAFLLPLASALCVTAGAAPASAHHSYAMFDRTKAVTLEGTVKEWQFTNPHSWLQLIVLENGTPIEYGVEGASVNTLIRIGWGPKTFKAGDKVTIVMNPLRDGTKGGAFVKATLPSGKTLSAGQTPG